MDYYTYFRRRVVETVVRESVAVSRSVEAPEAEPEPEFVPYTTDRPVGLDLDEFLPVSTNSLTNIPTYYIRVTITIPQVLFFSSTPVLRIILVSRGFHRH